MPAGIGDKFTQTFNSGNPNVAKVTAGRTSGASTLSCDNLGGWPTSTAVHFSTYKIDTGGNYVDGSLIDWKGIVSGNDIGSLQRQAGASDNGHDVGDIVQMNPTGSWGKDLIEGILQHANQDGTLANNSVGTPQLDFGFTGLISPFGGSSAPTGWILCDGRAVSRTTYSDLFGIIGTAYGNGDGSSTFNVPNLKQRFPLGQADSGTGSTQGGTGGDIDHQHKFTSPVGYASGDPYMLDKSDWTNQFSGDESQNIDIVGGTNRHQGSSSSASTEISTHTTRSNNPPFQVVKYIIKT